MEKKTQLCDKLQTILFCGFLAVFMLLFIILPDKSFSERENRYLQTFPSDTDFAESLFSGEFSKKINLYFADQFPFRDELCALRGLCEAALLKKENNGVLFGSDGYLIKRDDFTDEEVLRSNVSLLSSLKEDFNVSLAVAPRGVDVLINYIPSGFPLDLCEKNYEILIDETSAFELKYINIYSTLKSAHLSGREIYYKTDHHWTSGGAYVAYREIIQGLGKTPYDESDFEIMTVTNEFYGTNYNKSLAFWKSPDTIQIYEYEDAPSFSMQIYKYKDNRSDIKAQFSQLYDSSYLSGADKYSFFLSSNNARVKITSGEGREKLIVIKDSFFNSLAPFLALHYDLIIIDPRFYIGDLKELAEAEGVDNILCVFGMESLSSQNIKIIF